MEALTVRRLVQLARSTAYLVKLELSRLLPDCHRVLFALLALSASRVQLNALDVPKARGAQCLERSLSINATSVRTAPTTPLRAP